jgi:hypothetical protein
MDIGRRRIGVVVNLSSLFLFLVFYYAGRGLGWNRLLLIGGVSICLAVWLVSFITVHVRTGLWKFAHTKVDDLDERQVQVAHEALRYSYAAFTVICLLIMLFNATTGYRGHYMFDAILPVSLLYFAHILPSSVIAWTEKEF